MQFLEKFVNFHKFHKFLSKNCFRQLISSINHHRSGALGHHRSGLHKILIIFHKIYVIYTNLHVIISDNLKFKTRATENLQNLNSFRLWPNRKMSFVTKISLSCIDAGPFDDHPRFIIDSLASLHVDSAGDHLFHHLAFLGHVFPA